MKDSTCVYDLREIPLPTVAPEWKDTPMGDREITNKPDPTVALMWSGEFTPAIGDRVLVNMNGLGEGTIRAFFTEHGWLGLHVQLDAPPDWHRKQNKGRPYPGQALVFGAEVKKLDA